MSVLDFYTENGTNFGRELQGAPLGSSNPGTGKGNTYNVSGGITYTLTNTLLMDAHVGFVRMNTGCERRSRRNCRNRSYAASNRRAVGDSGQSDFGGHRDAR